MMVVLADCYPSFISGKTRCPSFRGHFYKLPYDVQDDKSLLKDSLKLQEDYNAQQSWGRLLDQQKKERCDTLLLAHTNRWRDICGPRANMGEEQHILVLSKQVSNISSQFSEKVFYPSEKLISLIFNNSLPTDPEIQKIVDEQRKIMTDAGLGVEADDTKQIETISNNIESLFASLSRRAHAKKQDVVQLTQKRLLLDSVRQEIILLFNLDTYDLKTLWDQLSSELRVFASTVARERPWGIIVLDDNGELIIRVKDDEPFRIPETINFESQGWIRLG